MLNLTSHLHLSVLSAPSGEIFSSFFSSLSTFLRALGGLLWPDSGDSNLPKEPGNKVYDIINCVSIYYEKGASVNAFLLKEKFRVQVSRG